MRKIEILIKRYKTKTETKKEIQELETIAEIKNSLKRFKGRLEDVERNQ